MVAIRGSVLPATNEKWIKAIWMVLVFVFSILACNNFSYGMNSGENMAEHKTIIVDRNSNNKEITVVCGDVIQIELESKGATGYQWHIEQISTEYTELLSEGAKDISKDKAGAPVMGYWRFKALKKGTAEILMRYYRSWEGPEKALEQFKIKVTISEKGE